MRKPLLFFSLPVVLVLLAFSFKKASSDDLVTRIALQLQKFYALYPQESIYLQQDKTLYSLGETIWFKAYAPQNAADSLSTVLYADLVGPDNKVRLSRKLKLRDGMAHGDFYLPDTLSEGLYQLRAYTNWMRNFDPEYYFTRELNISSPSLTEARASISFKTHTAPAGDSLVASLQFYKHPFEPIKNLKLRTQLVLDGKKGKSSSLETDAQGIARLPLFFSNAQSGTVKEALLMVQSDDKSNPFQRSYRLPVGQPALDLQFFPEGGHLVAGIPSRVGFKAVDMSGKGQQVAGTIRDQQDNTVMDFKSEHLGMGAFTFTPEPGKTYTAQLQLPNGRTAGYKLPEAKPEGVVLQVMQLSEHSVNFRIEQNFTNPATLGPMYLIAHAADSLILAVRANADKKVLESAIPASRFPAGLIHFTLFSADGKALSERLAFVNHPPQLQLNLTTDKTTYGKRQKVTMQLEARDANGKPVVGNFSLAVRDALSDLNQQPYETNIYTQLYLQGELKGNIEQPAYYFDRKQPQARRHLDLLLLTQGWRRFDWGDLLQDKLPTATHVPEQSISFSGRVEKELGKKTPQKSNLTLIFTPNTTPKDSVPALPNLVMAETNPDGSFRFVGLNFEDTLKVFVQARTPKGSNNQLIHLNRTAAPTPNFRALEGATLSPEQIAAYRRRISDWAKANRQHRLTTGAIQLKQVEITAKKQEVSDSHRIYGQGSADARIEVAQLTVTYPNILQYLASRVAGVQVYNDVDSMNRPIMKVSIRGGGVPIFILDGMRVELETVNTLNPEDIEAIEVLKGTSAAIFGTGSADGVIALFTKRGNPNYNYANQKAPGTLNFKLAGYNKPSEFYSPRYDVAKERHNLPDYRSTLHWQPNVKTDANGKATISFFTSDVITEFVAVCEGIARQGKVGATTYRFSSDTRVQP
ncbi:TonB-dependent receptor plug domain-containing protein [Pontibacter sp. BT731]|uniref:TonB-dependent receptor plug domain-containing protein n=1 Tax=Pontibacter coccineus TaxID=3063328 RepID=UPI0026E3EF7D|nr:TonB-dependent receptor plug domain-containing protein [Pontibacter sp. BT731]MDO6389366.1 TonB-dependent receptor plug domain-containing protein [Pontibacter sp. BT731]